MKLVMLNICSINKTYNSIRLETFKRIENRYNVLVRKKNCILFKLEFRVINLLNVNLEIEGANV